MDCYKIRKNKWGLRLVKKTVTIKFMIITLEKQIFGWIFHFDCDGFEK